MNNKERKKLMKLYAEKNIDSFFNLLEIRFEPTLDSYYINEILKFSTGFNIRLKREKKLKFCKKCKCFWNNDNLSIRLNPSLKSKEYICKNCGFVRRFKYKE